jgi:hypothetical protein
MQRFDLRQGVRSLGTRARVAVAGLLGIVLLAGGCSFADVFEWSGIPAMPAGEGTPATTVTATATVTGATGTTPTATRPRNTPIPTNTAWVYATQTPTSRAQASPTSTPTPRATSTPTPRPTSTPTPAPTRTPTPSPTPVPSLLPLLPDESQVPSGLRLDREVAYLTLEDVARESDNPDDYARRLREWGYTNGAAREFLYPNPGVVEFLSRILGLDTRVMEFRSAAAADEAIAYQKDFALRRPDWRLTETNVERIGDATVALRGTADLDGMEVRVSAIFVRHGNTVYRFVGISGGYDAFNDTLTVARQT